MNTSSDHVHLGLRRFGVFVGPVIALCLLLAGLAWQHFDRWPWEGFQPPDDVKAGRMLLAEKFRGPDYFNPDQGSPDIPFPLITMKNARSQMDGIAVARHLDTEGRAKLEKLMDSLAEPPPSRFFGEQRINVLQLNMGLDEMR